MPLPGSDMLLSVTNRRAHLRVREAEKMGGPVLFFYIYYFSIKVTDTRTIKKEMNISPDKKFLGRRLFKVA